MTYRSSSLRNLLFALATLTVAASTDAVAQEVRPAPGPIGRLPGTNTVSAPVSREMGGDFTLTDQKGERFQLASHRGQTVLLFFGYTSCADACPAMLTKLSSVYKQLGPQRDRVLTVFVSVDPQRDTPETLGRYMRYYGINAVGLTGKKAEIDAVVKQYGARYEIEQSDSALGYHIRHTTDLYLIDARGKVTQRFSYTENPALILAAVKQSIE